MKYIVERALFAGQRLFFDQRNFQVAAGDLVIIRGPSRVGKSSLFDRLARRRLVAKNTRFFTAFALLMVLNFFDSSFSALRTLFQSPVFWRPFDHDSAAGDRGDYMHEYLDFFGKFLRFDSNILFNLFMFEKDFVSLYQKNRFKILLYGIYTLLFIFIVFHALGIFFVSGLLFLPKVLTGCIKCLKLRQHYRLSVFLVMISVFLGFSFSLMQTNLSTVASIMISLIIVGGILLGINRSRHSFVFKGRGLIGH